VALCTKESTLLFPLSLAHAAELKRSVDPPSHSKRTSKRACLAPLEIGGKEETDLFQMHACLGGAVWSEIFSNASRKDRPKSGLFEHTLPYGSLEPP